MKAITIALLSLFAVFTVGKLVGMLQWSWIWVAAPLWICVLLYLSCFAAFKLLRIEHYGQRDA